MEDIQAISFLTFALWIFSGVFTNRFVFENTIDVIVKLNFRKVCDFGATPSLKVSIVSPAAYVRLFLCLILGERPAS